MKIMTQEEKKEFVYTAYRLLVKKDAVLTTSIKEKYPDYDFDKRHLLFISPINRHKFFSEVNEICRQQNFEYKGALVFKSISYSKCYKYFDFWQVALEHLKDYEPIDTEENIKDRNKYNHDYYLLNKDRINATREIRRNKMYPFEIKKQREKWNKASFKYKNKVCLYENNYYTLEQLQRKFKRSGIDTTTAKKYALNEEIQNAKCNYQGLEYTFIELCNELRINDKLQNWAETALNSITQNQ